MVRMLEVNQKIAPNRIHFEKKTNILEFRDQIKVDNFLLVPDYFSGTLPTSLDHFFYNKNRHIYGKRSGIYGTKKQTR